jgi:hypothetical protein
MKILPLMLLCVAVCAAGYSEEPYYRDLYADTWVATDALGRTMPGIETAGPLKTDKERTVSIFYITWHTQDRANGVPPYTADVAEILKKHPEARLDGAHPAWGPAPGAGYHWAEPEMGYFLSQDKWVIRRDMSMLTDAGVDVLIMDVTNAVRYWAEWDVTFAVMQEMKAEGNKVPQFCFWSFNGPAITVVQDLYEKIYKEERFKDLWFHWDGKPLLLCNGKPEVDANRPDIQHPNPNYDPAAKTDPNHPHFGDPDYAEEFYLDYTKEVREFFTLRTMWWGYYEWAGERFVGTEGNWSFGYGLDDERVRNMDPANLVAPWKGEPEQAAVTPAQHPMSMTGKSWTRANQQPELNEYDLPVPTHVPWLGKTVDKPEGYGINFQERWEEALAADPAFIYINDWNEWTAGKYHPTDSGLSIPLPAEEERREVTFMRRTSNFMFVDQYNSEFNRGIHPMKGDYTDNYYMQMAQNIRRYKGVRPIPELSGTTAISVDGSFDDWSRVKVEYRDTIGDTAHRDAPGYTGLHYTDTSGRNDIITAKVAVDADTVFFYAEAAADLTSHTDPNWMLLLIDADQDSATGWFGYDFLVNKTVRDNGTTTLMRWQDGAWAEVADLAYASTGKAIEVAVPRDLLGLGGDAFSFDFKWADNPADLADPISLCTHGDTAPNRRFNYRCIWKK